MPYWAVQGRQVCSVWLPLDSIPLESAVEYISGSHNWGQQFEPYHFMDSTPYEGPGLPPLHWHLLPLRERAADVRSLTSVWPEQAHRHGARERRRIRGCRSLLLGGDLVAHACDGEGW